MEQIISRHRNKGHRDERGEEGRGTTRGGRGGEGEGVQGGVRGVTGGGIPGYGITYMIGTEAAGG